MVFKDGCYQIAGRRASELIDGYMFILEPSQAVFGANPDASVTTLMQRQDNVIDEAVTATIGSKLSLFKTVDAPGAGSNPQASFTIFKDRKHLVAGKSIFLRIALKVIGQQPAQALSKRTYPQAIVPVLVEGADETLVRLVANLANKLP